MFKTLYGKLTVVLLALLCLMGLLYAQLTLFTIRSYFQEVTQQLNRPLAETLVAKQLPIQNGRINKEALNAIFDVLMMVNPSIEIYLLDPQGVIMGHSVPADVLQRQRIDLEPVQRFITTDPTLPLFGDDPRYRSGLNIFSASPVPLTGPPEGYLYVVLTGEDLISAARMLQTSYIVQLSAWALLAGLVFAVLSGAFLFHLLTRRLRRLTDAVEAFQQGDFAEPLQFPSGSLSPSPPLWRADEIDRLGTTFRAMADRIQQQLQTLHKVDTQRRELVANVSHDLRTPLTALHGYLETLVLQDPSISPREQQQYLDIALRNSERLGALITELFELAKLDSHEVQIDTEAFSLTDLIEDVVQKWRLRADQRNLTLDATFDEPLPFVLGDIGLIERVLDNLIQNALQYTPAGGRVDVIIASGPTHLAIRVKDTGSGIATADLDAIFDRFYRGNPNHQQPGSGSGLGLAIVKRILELHGSRIRVESTLDLGSTFSFELPIAGHRYRQTPYVPPF